MGEEGRRAEEGAGRAGERQGWEVRVGGGGQKAGEAGEAGEAGNARWGGGMGGRDAERLVQGSRERLGGEGWAKKGEWKDGLLGKKLEDFRGQEGRVESRPTPTTDGIILS